MRLSVLGSISLLALLAAPSLAVAQGAAAEPAPAAAKAAESKAAPSKEAKPADAGGAAAAPAAGPAAPAAGTTAAPAPAVSADGHTPEQRVQLKALEQRVNELKERIFRSKARLNLLKETVLHGVIAGSRAVIRHTNEMGSAFRLVKAAYAVDGAQIYSSSNETELNEKKEFDVFNGSIVPGNHTISVIMVFRGHGYGIFTYLKGYRFTVRASYTLTATEGRQNVIAVRAFERGNATTELKDRPAIKFQPSLYKVGTAQPATNGANKGAGQ